MAGQTNDARVVASLQNSNASSYTVVLTNTQGSVTSSIAFVRIRLPPSIPGQPTNGAGDVGGSATLSVVVSGSAPLTYQWRWNTNVLAGQTNRALVLTNLQLPHFGQYSVVVSNSLGSATSQMAGLGIYITVAPLFAPALSISRSASGTAVRWQENGQLQRASGVTGPWQLLSAASPFTNISRNHAAIS